jgi:hypothetical protein
MQPNTPASPAPPPPSSASLPTARKSRWLLYGCGGIVGLFVLIVATILITYWWIQRPIKPVVLSAQERTAVDEKLQRIGGGNTGAGRGTTSPDSNSGRQGTSAPSLESSGPETGGRQDRAYTPGSKVLKITEREINGLLNANTDLGKSVRLEFGQDSINAYVAIHIPEDFPIGGGKMFRARGRFRLSLGNGAEPYAILENVTVLGLSLPKAWLGGLKGENLIGQAMGERKRSALRGVKSLHVEPGALVLEVED